MDFEAHTISTNDFNGIKKLLQQVLHNIPVLHLNYEDHYVMCWAQAWPHWCHVCSVLETGLPKGSY